MKQKIAFALLMGGITTGIISLTLVALNIGLTKGFPIIWLRSWFLAYVIVIPVILFLSPKVQRLITKLLPEKKSPLP